MKKNIIFDIKNYQFDNLSYRLLLKYTVISKTHGNWEQLVINEIDFINLFLSNSYKNYNVCVPPTL